MKVLWFADYQPLAVRRRLGLAENPGPQAWVDALADRLQQPGVELSIATHGATGLPSFEDSGITYHVLEQPTQPSRLARVVAGWRHRLPPAVPLREAVALVRRLAPDLVHVHGTEGASGLLAPVVFPTPCVISLQGILQAYERLYFAGRSVADMAAMVASRDFLLGRGPMHSYLLVRRWADREEQIMRGARWFIGRTDWDKAMLAAVNPAATYFHCDEIMRAPFYKAEWTPPSHFGTRLYTTSSSLMGKGTECLVEALSILRREGMTGVRLRIAGVPPGSGLESTYRRVARRRGVEQAVDWLGRLDAAHIVDELMAADVFVYASHVDNSPNSVVEAMAVGVPIVASSVGGLPTLVKDREEGLLVPRGDAGAFAGAIRRLLDDTHEARRIGARARVTAQARNDPDRIVKRTISIYQEIVASAGEFGRGVDVHRRGPNRRPEAT
jgi:glycosyltransferase involved in cell wall biosynthesis